MRSSGFLLDCISKQCKCKKKINVLLTCPFFPPFSVKIYLHIIPKFYEAWLPGWRRAECAEEKFHTAIWIAAVTVTSWSPGIMYCLQWLLPVLLIPKPLNPALWFSHSMFMGFYLLSFLLERKPCTICALVFLAALFLICYSCWGNCFLYHCSGSQLPDSAHDPNIVGT